MGCSEPDSLLTHRALPNYAYASIGDTNPDAKANALRAIKIDESLPQAHALLAGILNIFAPPNEHEKK